MTDTKPKQVALYARVSTKDKGQDVANQTDTLDKELGLIALACPLCVVFATFAPTGLPIA